MNENGPDQDSPDYSRRETLSLAGGALGTTTGIGTLAQGMDDSYDDTTGDGIPDLVKQSDSYHQYLEDVFGADQFEGLDSERRDLLLDVRYVGRTSVSEQAKMQVEELFRDNGIHLQWLDYPQRYGQDEFESEYGYKAENLLWPTNSFYDREIQNKLKDIAIQVIVVPDAATANSRQHLHASFHTLSKEEPEGFAGMSFGNRAVVTDRDDIGDEVELVIHEVAHLALCHDDDPNNTGVMGPDPQQNDLTESEWETLRGELDNVKDDTGYDIALRPCIWREYYEEVIAEKID